MEKITDTLTHFRSLFMDANTVLGTMPATEQCTRMASVRETSNAMLEAYSANDDALNRLLALENLLETLNRNAKERIRSNDWIN